MEGYGLSPAIHRGGWCTTQHDINSRLPYHIHWYIINSQSKSVLDYSFNPPTLSNPDSCNPQYLPILTSIQASKHRWLHGSLLAIILKGQHCCMDPFVTQAATGCHKPPNLLAKNLANLPKSVLPPARVPNG